MDRQSILSNLYRKAGGGGGGGGGREGRGREREDISFVFLVMGFFFGVGNRIRFMIFEIFYLSTEPKTVSCVGQWTGRRWDCIWYMPDPS